MCCARPSAPARRAGRRTACLSSSEQVATCSWSSERRTVFGERPAVRDAEVGAAQHLHATAAQVADDTLLAVSGPPRERAPPGSPAAAPRAAHVVRRVPGSCAEHPPTPRRTDPGRDGGGVRAAPRTPPAGGRGRASALPQGYRRFRAPHRHQSRSPIELSKLPNAADSSQCADEPDVPDRVCELRSPRRLQVRQQVELTPVVGTMMRAA
jgi:hypothetical protein